jgi:hypothetical protein
MEEWENSGAWKRDGAWYERTGGEFVRYRRTPLAGTLSFTIEPPGGNFLHRDRIEWFCGYRDDRNYTLFRLEGKRFSSVRVVDGAQRPAGKVDLKLDNKKEWTVRVAVSSGRITHTVIVDGQSRQISELPGTGLDQGRFGFLIPAGTVMRIKDFHFQPR